MHPLLKSNTVMKRILCIAVACLAVVLCFNSCKLDVAEQTIVVVDNDSLPVANRTIYYTNIASICADILSPIDPLTDGDFVGMDSLSTNAQGTVTKKILANLLYVFAVKDEGTNEYITKSVKAPKGNAPEIIFVVSK